MRVVQNLQELDEVLELARNAQRHSDDALREVFASFTMNLEDELPADPFSAEYASFQANFYQRLAGRDYDVSNEVTAFDVSKAVARPFPFFTGSVTTVGNHLAAMGFVISRLQLPPNARILEFGAGWGNTTLSLAAAGFQVTAVDIEARFCQLVEARAAALGLPVNVVNSDFFWVDQVSEPYDAVLFYECFHHCADHLRLLQSLHRAIKPGGRVYLGCEPILSDFPAPWGLRMDGESLWAIRQNGWMELGFNEAYFHEALRRTGWSARSFRSQDIGWANLWELTPQPVKPLAFAADADPMFTQVGRRENGGLVVQNSDPGYALFGPYITLTPGSWRAQIRLTPGAQRCGAVQIDAFSCEQGVFAERHFHLDGDVQDDSLQLGFNLKRISKEVEIRVHCDRDTVATISEIELQPA